MPRASVWHGCGAPGPRATAGEDDVTRLELGANALVVAMDHAQTRGVTEPARVMRALRAIIHESASVNDALTA